MTQPIVRRIWVYKVNNVIQKSLNIPFRYKNRNKAVEPLYFSAIACSLSISLNYITETLSFAMLNETHVVSEQIYTNTVNDFEKYLSTEKEIALSSRKVSERHSFDVLKKLSIFSDRVPMEQKRRVSNSSI